MLVGRGEICAGCRQILDGDGEDKGIFIYIWHWNGGAGRLPEEVKGLLRCNKQRLGSASGLVYNHTPPTRF